MESHFSRQSIYPRPVSRQTFCHKISPDGSLNQAYSVRVAWDSGDKLTLYDSIPRFREEPAGDVTLGEVADDAVCSDRLPRCLLSLAQPCPASLPPKTASPHGSTLGPQNT